MEILGCRVDNLSFDEAFGKAVGLFYQSGKHFIVTPNPEIIVLSRNDNKLKEIINKSSLSIADGVGLVLASRFLGKKLKCRVAGVDLADKLLEYCAERKLVAGFLGGRRGVAKKASEHQLKTHPGLKIAFALETDPEEAYEVIKKEGKNIDLLLVAYGAPKQEKWIFDNLPKLPVKVAMGVGGAFDYWSGRVRRAPYIVQRFGFEWLWRLLRQPWRIKRQIRLLVFVLLILRERGRLLLKLEV